MSIDERFDASGWSVGLVAPLARDRAYTLFTADSGARFDARMLTPHAAKLAGVVLTIEPAKQFAHGAVPTSDSATIILDGDDLLSSRVAARILPIERAWDLKRAARAAGAMGMETLVDRARKIIQIEAAVIEGDARAPLVCAAVFAGTFLAAVFPPDEDVLFGLKGAKERLEAPPRPR